jgi:hypothetical protein
VNTLSATTSVLLAHQGGWDEILLIAGPIVIIMALLWVAKRRVDHAASLHGHGVTHADQSPGHSPTDSD